MILFKFVVEECLKSKIIFNRQRNLLPAPQNPQPGWSFPNRAVLDCPWADSREVKALGLSRAVVGALPTLPLPFPCPVLTELVVSLSDGEGQWDHKLS